MRRRAFVLLLAAVLVFSMLAVNAGAYIDTPRGQEFPVSLADEGQIQPDIDYPWIVYRSMADCNPVLRVYNFETGEDRMIADYYDAETNPSISGNWVVFGNTCDVYAINIMSRQTIDITYDNEEYEELYTNYDEFGNPAIDGTLVVHNAWTAYGDGDILSYDVASGEATAVCDAEGDQWSPEIGDGWIVWRDSRLEYGSIWGYNTETAEETTIALASDVEGADFYYDGPSTDSGLVVANKTGYWGGIAQHQDAIVLIDLETMEETVISQETTLGAREHPVINDGFVTWHDKRSGAMEVYCYDLLTGTESCIVAAVEDDPATPNVNETKFAGRTTTADGIVAWHDHRYEYDELGDEINDDGTSDSDLYAMLIPWETGTKTHAGADRYATAVQVSQDTFPEGADTVIVATGRNFPDALAGASLAGAYQAPVLLVDTTIPGIVVDEIERLGATDVVILGGTSAISAQVEGELEDLGLTVARFGGADRFATAAVIAEEAVGLLGDNWDGTAFLATGYNWPDALSAGPLASSSGCPIFLGGPDGINNETLAAMNELGVQEFFVLGGPSAISVQSGAGVGVTAIAGADRYETAAAVAEFGQARFGLEFRSLALATGEAFPDALSAGAAQGVKGGSLLITPRASLHDAIAASITAHENQLRYVEFIGGLQALTQTVRDAVTALIP